MTKPDPALISVKPETMLRVPFGFASPLWGFFAGAAVGGTAWWLMTRWARPANLEAMFGGAAELEGPIGAEFEVSVAALEAPSVMVETTEVVVADFETPAFDAAPALEVETAPAVSAETNLPASDVEAAAAPDLAVEPSTVSEPVLDPTPVLAAELPAVEAVTPTRQPRAKKAPAADA